MVAALNYRVRALEAVQPRLLWDYEWTEEGEGHSGVIVFTVTGIEPGWSLF
jgi:hypothetical protein